MEKLKFKNLATVGDVLSPEELKRVYGGSGSGSNNGSLKPECICSYTLPSGYDTAEFIYNIPNESICRYACDAKCAFNPEISNCISTFRMVPV